ncbi:hypothetical protein M5K25_015427 [Dendrobium thyrsiflorum]|uniref:SWIM-type domain-containing protein n=1 Tax=Dendrobium thyrsiflorum TaxID=117978 RepID=A0ABD0UR38_DENTH
MVKATEGGLVRFSCSCASSWYQSGTEKSCIHGKLRHISDRRTTGAGNGSSPIISSNLKFLVSNIKSFIPN